MKVAGGKLAGSGLAESTPTGTALWVLPPTSRTPSAATALLVLLVFAEAVFFVAGAELLFDRCRPMRRRHVDLQSKRHLVVTNWAIHVSGF